MGTACSLKWIEVERERIWTIKSNHPIVAGVDETFVLEPEEMHGERFDIPEPEEVFPLVGSREERYSEVDAHGQKDTERYSISNPVMSKIPLIETKMYRKYLIML